MHTITCIGAQFIKNLYYNANSEDNQHVITSVFSIYKYFYPKQGDDINEFVEKLNKKYNLKLTSTNFS